MALNSCELIAPGAFHCPTNTSACTAPPCSMEAMRSIALRHTVQYLYISFCLLLVFCLLVLQNRLQSNHAVIATPSLRLHRASQYTIVSRRSEVTLIVASQTTDNTTWLTTAFPAWDKKIYVADSPNATLTVPVNKGSEAMTYLTYIIDHYNNLPAVSIFLHAQRYQWHNDDPLYDGQRMLERLQMPYVKEQGCVNLRCVWTIGCPAEIHPVQEEDHRQAVADSEFESMRAGAYYKQAFQILFPGLPVPDVVGASCCAQFAVTRDTVLKRPRSDYERYRRWLLETELDDDLSGRVMEYPWHSKIIACM